MQTIVYEKQKAIISIDSEINLSQVLKNSIDISIIRLSSVSSFVNVETDFHYMLKGDLKIFIQEMHQEVLKTIKKELEKSGSVKFSKHAMERIRSRGVEMSPQMMESLNQAVTKAREKGCKDIAVIGEKNAFIVSVQNNTVITTMNALEMRENIFTNIDSAVLL